MNVIKKIFSKKFSEQQVRDLSFLWQARNNQSDLEIKEVALNGLSLQNIPFENNFLLPYLNSPRWEQEVKSVGITYMVDIHGAIRRGKIHEYKKAIDELAKTQGNIYLFQEAIIPRLQRARSAKRMNESLMARSPIEDAFDEGNFQALEEIQSSFQAVVGVSIFSR